MIPSNLRLHFQIQSDLGYLDIIAFAGYKFVPIILALTCGLLSNSHAVFLGALIYGSVALCVFLVRSLKVRVQSNAAAAHGQYAAGDTRKYVFEDKINCNSS